MTSRRRAPARTSRAAAFSLLAVVLLLLLRAKSDGARPGLLVIAASLVALAIAVRPLTARERSLPVVAGGLLAAQLALHVGFLFASTGQLAHAGGAGLFCSPAASAGRSCGPTERGGVLLLAVQVLAALAFAGFLRYADAVGWRYARQSVGEFFAMAASVGLDLTRSLLAVASRAEFDAPTSTAVPPSEPPAVLRLAPLFARRHGRRGPPRPRRLPVSSAPAPLAFSSM